MFADKLSDILKLKINKHIHVSFKTPLRSKIDVYRTESYYIERSCSYLLCCIFLERRTIGTFECFFIYRHLDGQNLYYLFSVRPYFTHAPHSLIPGAHVTRLGRTYFHLKNFPLHLQSRLWGSLEVLRRLSFFRGCTWPMCFTSVKERGKTFKRVRGLLEKLRMRFVPRFS